MPMDLFVLVLEFLSRFLGKRGAKIVICLVLMSCGLKNTEIRDRFGLSWDSLRKYRTAFETKNIAPSFEMDAKRKQSELAQYKDVIMI